MERTVEKVLPGYTAEQLFAVAVDVERYPTFLPNCVAARVLRDDGDRQLVDNLFRIGPFRTRFTTRTQFVPPRSIDTWAVDGPVRDLRFAWRFQPVDGGCRATFTIGLGVIGAGLGALPAGRFVRRLMDDTEARILTAFQERVAELYSPGLGTGDSAIPSSSVDK
ncbi:MAG: type II toxin-antitoxin system RatA family toxin [Rhodobacterales bacterium]|nr:type II toxin-antitoxin system RatA family toxin [Rhodobacterales bacterium]